MHFSPPLLLLVLGLAGPTLANVATVSTTIIQGATNTTTTKAATGCSACTTDAPFDFALDKHGLFLAPQPNEQLADCLRKKSGTNVKVSLQAEVGQAKEANCFQRLVRSVLTIVRLPAPSPLDLGNGHLLSEIEFHSAALNETSLARLLQVVEEDALTLNQRLVDVIDALVEEKHAESTLVQKLDHLETRVGHSVLIEVLRYHTLVEHSRLALRVLQTLAGDAYTVMAESFLSAPGLEALTSHRHFFVTLSTDWPANPQISSFNEEVRPVDVELDQNASGLSFAAHSITIELNHLLHHGSTLPKMTSFVWNRVDLNGLATIAAMRFIRIAQLRLAPAHLAKLKNKRIEVNLADLMLRVYKEGITMDEFRLFREQLTKSDSSLAAPLLQLEQSLASRWSVGGERSFARNLMLGQIRRVRAPEFTLVDEPTLELGDAHHLHFNADHFERIWVAIFEGQPLTQLTTKALRTLFVFDAVRALSITQTLGELGAGQYPSGARELGMLGEKEYKKLFKTEIDLSLVEVESIAAEGLTPKNLALLAKKLLIEPKEYFEALFTKMVWTLEPHSSDSSEPITFRPHKAPAPNAHAHDRAVANEVSFKPIESIMKAYGLRVHAKEEPKVEFDLALAGSLLVTGRLPLSTESVIDQSKNQARGDAAVCAFASLLQAQKPKLAHGKLEKPVKADHEKTLPKPILPAKH